MNRDPQTAVLGSMMEMSKATLLRVRESVGWVEKISLGNTTTLSLGTEPAKEEAVVPETGRHCCGDCSFASDDVKIG